MKTKLLFTILFALCMLSLNAQDIIIKKNGDEIKSKVLEVGKSEIKYKNFDNVNGLSYTIDKSDVFMIQYANGTKDIFSKMNAPPATEQKKSDNPNKLFQEHKSYVSLGYGLGVVDNFIYDLGGISSTSGPIYVKYEYGMSEDLSVGINLAYLESELSDNYIDPGTGNYIVVPTDTYTSFSVLLRANWHFGNSEKIDPYYGFGLGYRHNRWKSNSQTEGNDYLKGHNPLGFETTFGIKMRFSEHMGAYAEAGISKAILQLGLMAKF